MRKTGLLVFLLLLSISVVAKPIEIISESANELLVKFILPDYELSDIERDGVLYQKIICDGGADPGEPGYPELPFFSELIGLPVDGSFDVTIIEKKQKVIADKNIFPADVPVGNDSEVEFVFKPNQSFRKRKDYYPAQLVQKGKPAYLGDRYFSSFKINPFRVNASTKELQITNEITFKIHISGDLDEARSWQQNENYNGESGDKLFLNNSYSKKWRKPRPEPVPGNYNRSSAVDEIQIFVNERGIYKIDYAYLADSLATIMESNPDLNFNFQVEELDPRYLELSDEDGSVPIQFVGDQDGSFDEGDYFEFFGDIHHGDDAYYDDYTSENIYTLKLVDHFGSRMAVENGGIVEADPGDYIVPEAYQQTIHFEEQNFKENLGWQFSYHGGYGYFREDIWFWNSIMSPDMKTIPFSLDYPFESEHRRYDAKVALFGITYDESSFTVQDHHAVVRINSAIIGNETWNGQREKIFENDTPIPNSYLQNGENNLFISLPGVEDYPNEKVLLDYFELTYWREYVTDTNSLEFHKPENKPGGLYQFELQNFRAEDVTIYKIGSSIIENYQVIPFSETGESPYKIVFQDEVEYSSIEYIAVTESEKKLPILIKPNKPSSLKDTFNSAEYIIITSDEFKEAEGTLLFEEVWEEQGYNVEVVAIEDIFDEFNHGIRSAQAIKDFLKYAYQYWTEPVLSHVMLLGDGMLDERDNSYQRKYSIIPTKITWSYKIGAIADDNWFACIVGDDIVPDISLARINVWEEEQILDVANKTKHYLEETNYQDLWHSRAIYASGGNPSEGSAFAADNEEIINNFVPTDFHKERVYCNVEGYPDNYFGNTTDLISTINDGVLYTQFIGHGGGHVWADYNLLNLADISSFNNENYPLVSSLSCYGSAFNNPQSSCIGEELILTPEKGAIGHFGFTGYGYAGGDLYLGKHLNDALYNHDDVTSMGDIIKYAKIRMYGGYGSNSVGVALICGGALLGDPMIQLLPTKEERGIELAKYNLEPGDTLRMSAEVGNNVVKGKFVIYDENDVALSPDQYYPLDHYAINNVISAEDYIVPAGDDIYSRTIKLFAFGTEYETVGTTQFTVGQSAVVNFTLIPEVVTENDTVLIEADFFDKDGIASVDCMIDTVAVPMENIGGSRYQLSSAFAAKPANSLVQMQFRIVDGQEEAETTLTDIYEYKVSAPDMNVLSLEFSDYNNQLSLYSTIINIGQITSPECAVKVFSHPSMELITQKQMPSLEPGMSQGINIPLPLLNGEFTFMLMVNYQEESFSELSYPYNNYRVTDEYAINMFEVGSGESSASSLDEVLDVKFQANTLPEATVCTIRKLDFVYPENQPDIAEVVMADSLGARSYTISIANETLLADTLGTLPDGNKIRLKFHYSVDDSLTQQNESADNFAVYRWEGKFRKWIYHGGEIFTDDDYVSYYADRLGTYALLQNNDTTPPEISVNVEGQEFNLTSGTPYISKNGIISFILSDQNGVNGIDKPINLEVDGEHIASESFFVSASPGHLEQLPVKLYLSQLDLDPGIYNIYLDCTDINGNYQSKEFDFKVSGEFGIRNLANYPNPVVSKSIHAENKGRTRFTYVLLDDADEVTLKVYSVNGRLVKKFKNLPNSVGYHEYPTSFQGWDCRDDEGFSLANGVYFYKVVAKKDGKKAEKTQKMAILK